MSKETELKVATMQAFQMGKSIQSIDLDDPNAIWEDDKSPTWDWYGFNYRIKPKEEIVKKQIIKQDEKPIAQASIFVRENGTIEFPKWAYEQLLNSGKDRFFVRVYKYTPKCVGVIPADEP